MEKNKTSLTPEIDKLEVDLKKPNKMITLTAESLLENIRIIKVTEHNRIREIFINFQRNSILPEKMRSMISDLMDELLGEKK